MGKGKRYLALFLAVILVVTVYSVKDVNAAQNGGNEGIEIEQDDTMMIGDRTGATENIENAEKTENAQKTENDEATEVIEITENAGKTENDEAAEVIEITENVETTENPETIENPETTENIETIQNIETITDTESVEEESIGEPENMEQSEEEGEAAEQKIRKEKNLIGASRTGVYRAVFDGTSTKKDIQTVLNMIRDGEAEKLEVTLTGNIELNGGLVVYSNTTINATGATIKSTSSNAALLASATAKNFGNVMYEDGYQKTQNITVIGGTWDGNGVIGQIVRFVHSSNVVLDGLMVKNCTNTGHLITFEGVSQALVQNCTVIGHSGMGQYKEAIHLDIVHNSVTTPNLMSGEYDDLPNRNITIRNNVIKDAANGIGSHGAVRGVYHQNIVIANNDISNIREMALLIFNYKNITITGNTIHDSNYGIKAYTYYDVNNIDCKEPLANAVLEPDPIGCNYQIVVQGNTFRDISVGPSVWIQGNENREIGGTRIENNVFGGNMTGNIVYAEYLTDGVISGNVFQPQKEAAPDIGIYGGYAKNVVISGNTINDMAVAGIKIENNSHGTQLKKNVISNCKKVGIYSLYSKVSIEENQISDISGDALCVWNAGKNMIISKNKLKNIKGIGIGLNATKKAQITGNTLENVKGYAINLNVATANEKARKMPAVKKITAQKGIVTGKAVKGSKYKVKVNGKKYKVTIKKGKFTTAKIKKLKKKSTVTIIETTAGKNKLIKNMTVK